MKIKNSILIGCLSFLLCQFTNAQNYVEQHVGVDKLRGISLAIIENYEIAEVQYSGVKSKATQEKIDEHTAFSAASISKPITAILCAILEERGYIDLEDPISQYLKRWHLPDLEVLNNTPVTWEHLLSHTSGATQEGFEDYYEGDDIPTLTESLEGHIPGYEEPISFQFQPCSGWEYSGGGYTIIQMALEDTMQKSLAELATEYLFQPLGMSRTTMHQPNSTKFLDNVACAHGASGEVIGTGIPITPQVAASGMWTTPKDLAKLAIEIQLALKGDKTNIISSHVAKRVTNVYTLKGVGGWSLGFERRFGFGNNEWFSHGGANTGTGGYLYATIENGRGVIIFGNGPNTVRNPVVNQVRQEVIETYDWQRELSFKEQLVPQDLSSEVTGVYHNSQGQRLILKDSLQKLYASPAPRAPQFPLIYLGNRKFYLALVYPNLMLFEKNNSDWTINLIRDGVPDTLTNFFVKRAPTKVKVTFQVIVPDKHDEVYITGNQKALGDWQPGIIKLEKTNDLKREITLDLIMPAEFKFTQGSWNKEAIVHGSQPKENLKLDLANPKVLNYEIMKWHINKK